MNIFRKISEQFTSLPLKNEKLGFPVSATVDTALICGIISLFTGFQLYMYFVVSAVIIASIAVYFLTDDNFCDTLSEIFGWIVPLLFIVFIVLLVFVCG